MQEIVIKVNKVIVAGRILFDYGDDFRRVFEFRAKPRYLEFYNSRALQNTPFSNTVLRLCLIYYSRLNLCTVFSSEARSVNKVTKVDKIYSRCSVENGTPLSCE